jgi:hypothetical protein
MLGAGLDELVAGRLDGDPDRAREAARCFREFGAPWWLSKALRAFGALGGAGADEVTEAARIERGLGIPSVR